MKKTLLWSIAVLCAAIMLMTMVSKPSAQTGGGMDPTPAQAGRPGQSRLLAKYGELPLSFEANTGQANSAVKFLSRGQGYTLFLTGDEAVLNLRESEVGSQEPGVRAKDFARLGALRRTADHGPRTGDVLRMRLVGANLGAVAKGAAELPGKSNYFLGNDPKEWRTSIPNYAQVKYVGVYPGVDLVYYGNQGGQLEYDFVVAPGADPSAIKLDVGAVREPPTVAAVSPRHAPSKNGGVKPPLQIAPDGDLVVQTEGGEVRFHKPVVYQPATNTGQRTTDNPQRTAIDGHYVLQAGNQIGFKVASYDHSRPLFIDPVLSYSTYLGGSYLDEAFGIALDSSGNAYVTGYSDSTDFPTMNAIQATSNGGQDVFVAKLNAAGTALVYSTYLGGSGNDSGSGIAVDSSGNAYVTGTTGSRDFPTVNPLQATNTADTGTTGFVAKLNPAGSALVYSTYFGGTWWTEPFSIAADSSGNAYVTGQTYFLGFPTTAGAFQTTGTNPWEIFAAFVAKLNAAGSALVYSTLLGGNSSGGSSEAFGIAVDTSGNAYVTGWMGYTDFPTVNPVQATCVPTINVGTSNASCQTPFVTKLNSDGSGLVYSTYLGGSTFDVAYGIALDSSGNAYVTGYTESTDFPTVNPIQATNNGGFSDAFVAELNTAGSALVYSTYLGGSGEDYGDAIAVDSSGNAYVTGNTYSTDFPMANPIQATCGGCPYLSESPFVAELSANGSALVYSTYLGNASAAGIAVDTSGNAYVTGTTGAHDFPTVNPLQPTNGGQNAFNAFVAKISPANLPGVSLIPLRLTFPAQLVGTPSQPQTITLLNVGSAPLTISSIVPSGGFSEADTCGAGLAGGGASCTISVTFTPTTTGTETGALTITDNSNGIAGSQQRVNLSGVGTAPSPSLSAASVGFGAEVINVTSSSRTVTLTNSATATAALSPVTISVSGTNMTDFAQTNNCSASLAPGTKCVITLTFTPSLLAAETATLNVADNAANSPQTVSLLGTGVAPVVWAPLSLSFNSVGEGSASAAQSIKLTNNQSVALSVTNIGMSNKDYSETDNCVGSVAAKGTCTITVTLTPTVLGTDPGTLSVYDNAVSSPQTIPLTGTGVAPVTFSAPTLGFGNVGENSASAPQTLTLTNKQTEALNISSIGMSTTDYKETDNCVGSVPAKGTCTITVTLTPSVLGTDPGTLTVNDSALGGYQTVALTGTGVLPVSFSTTTLAFGNVGVKSPSAPHSFTLVNQQAQALSITSIVPSPSDYTETDTCGGSVGAKGTCTIRVTLTPSALGTDNGTLTITDSAPNSPQTVTLTGAGVAPVSFSAATLTFGNVGVNTASPAQTSKLINNQTVALNISSIGVSNGDYKETDNCVGSVPANGTCTITVTLTPSAVGTDNGTLSVTDNAYGSPQTVALTGAGVAPVTFSAMTLAFWNIGENSASAAQTTKLINNQTVALNVTSIGMSNADYAETDICVGTVPAKGTCTITVTLTPTVLGTDNGTLTVNDNASTSPQSVTLNGTSILPAVLSAPTLGFGNVAQGIASSPKTLTLSNRENVALSISSITTGNPDFGESDNCNGSVAAKGSCTITLTLTPSVIGAETGTLTVTDAASNTPQTATLTGTGIAQAALSPTSLSFGTQKAGTTSGVKAVTLTNNLPTALTIGITFGGADPGDFGETDNCVGSVAAKSSCTIKVTFTPGGTGSRAGTLQVADSANNTPQTIPLTGTGD